MIKNIKDFMKLINVNSDGDGTEGSVFDDLDVKRKAVSTKLLPIAKKMFRPRLNELIK